ncbi:MAG: hypothetical protein JOZ41_13970 [Chloroflexi bacterium]|nr:hypothetical protein [Chloroflexota bacterium]
MEAQRIRHRPRHLDATLIRRLEIERECPSCPDGEADVVARCPDCDSTMLYRGIGRLRSGTRVHYFECVHSHREVHSLSIVIGDQAS